MKGLNDDCEHFESFPPGHLYSSKEGIVYCHEFIGEINCVWLCLSEMDMGFV